MAAFTFVDTRLRTTTTLSYILEGQNRVHEERRVSYSQGIDDVYVPISLAQHTATRAALIALNCQIIRLDPIFDVAVTPLENPLHRRVTNTTDRDEILRIFVAQPVPTFTGASKVAAI